MRRLESAERQAADRSALDSVIERIAELKQRLGADDRRKLDEYLESIRDEFDSGQSPQLGEAENAVRIMSIHRAKGLEFPVVFVPELGKRINFQSCSGNILADRKLGLGLSAIDRRKRTE